MTAPARVAAVGDFAIVLIIFATLRASFTLAAVLTVLTVALVAKVAKGNKSIAPMMASVTALSSLPNLLIVFRRSDSAKGLSAKKNP